MAFLMPLTKQITYMQILITKFKYHAFMLLILSVSFSSSSMADTEFNDYFQMPSTIDSRIADQVTRYHAEDIALNPAQQKQELTDLEKQLNRMQDKYNRDASYWFIKGLNNKNMAAFYNSTGNIKLANLHTQTKNEDYRQALILSENTPDTLTPAIYNAMKHGLSENLKIQATQSELSLGGNADNESAYWHLHWSNIDQLKKAGRDDEAKQAFENMQNEMREKNVDMSVYGELNEAIEKTTFKNSATNSTQTRKPDENIKADSTDKAEDEPAEDKADYIMPMLLFFSIVSLVLVTVYEFIIKKRKK